MSVSPPRKTLYLKVPVERKPLSITKLLGVSTAVIIAVVMVVLLLLLTSGQSLGPFGTTTTQATTVPLTTTPTTTQATTAPSYSVHHEWRYEGIRWTYDAEIPRETYEYFSNKPRVSYYSEYVDNPADDVWMEKLAHLFVEEAEKKGWGEFETVSFVLAFVQSWPYTSDDVTKGYDEYPRYPVETIVDGGGDCEDMSILFSSIVRGMGYGTVLLKLEEDDHMAVGVLISQEIVNNWNQHYPLTYYTSNGKIYAYCETTGEGWELGHRPEDLKSTSARLIFI